MSKLVNILKVSLKSRAGRSLLLIGGLSISALGYGCGIDVTPIPTSRPEPTFTQYSLPTPTPESIGLLVYPEDSNPSSSTINGLMEKGLLNDTAILYHVPDVLGYVLSQHVQAIMSSGYAESLDSNDFYHGHLMAADPYFCSREQVEMTQDIDIEGWLKIYLEADPHFIYHTREHLGPRNPYVGPPRSIIGTIDGNVHPMISDEEHFISHGTVHGYEPFEFDNKKSEGMCQGNLIFGFDSEKNIFHIDVTTSLGNIEAKFYSPTFYILQDTNGRYKLTEETKFDIFFRLIEM